MSGLKKVDDLTFTVTLSEPYIDFKTMLGYTAFYPMPEAAFSAPGVLKDSYEQAPIGQGPFKMKGTWQHDAKIEVERYDAFPGEKPKVKNVEFRIYQQLDRGLRGRAVGQPGRDQDDPDREPEHRAERPGRPVPDQPDVVVPVPRVPDVRQGLQQPGRAQGHLDGDRP